jgi:hypothetical protein
MFEDLCVHSLAGPNLFAPRLLFIPPKRLVNPGCTGGLHWPAAAHFAHARPSQWPIRIASTPLLHLCDYQKMSLKMGDQKWPKMSLTAIHGDARLVSFPGGEEGPVKAGVGRGSNPSPCTLTWPWREPTLWESWQMPIFDAKFISK